MNTAANAACPICEAEVEIVEGTVIGELMECGDCGTELEITKVDPIEIQEAPEVEEDWGE